MINRKYILLIAVLKLFAINPVISQFKFEKSILINKETGLPSNTVRAIAKSKDGFIWLGTHEGLCRFDGTQVRIFQEGNDLRYSLFDNSIFAVLPVDNDIWVGTSQGLSVLHNADYTFRHYQLTDTGKSKSLSRKFDQQVSVLFSNKAGNIFVGTRDRGVCMYDREKDNFRFFHFPRAKYPQLVPSLGSDHSILSITSSNKNDSIIWAGTPSGLQEINFFNGRVHLYTFPQQSKDYQVALNAFRRLYHHDDGLLYVGSWGASVNIFDPVTKTFTPLNVKNPEGKKIINNVITNISRKNDHEIWISTGAGVVVYDSDLKEITWYKHNNPSEFEFYGISFIDDVDRIWYSNTNGLNYFDPAMQQFSNFSYKHLSAPDWTFAFYILSDRSANRIIVCPRFTDGIFYFDRQKHEWSKTFFPGNTSFKTERDVVRGFVQLANGDFVISCDRGIFLYSEKKKRMTALHEELPVAAPTRRGAILLDRSGNLWLSDDVQGLIKWQPDKRTYRMYNSDMQFVDTTKTFRLENLFEDSRGNIWFQRGNGLGVYLAAHDSIINFIYSVNESNSFPLVNAFAEDNKGRVWISGGDGWLGYGLSAEPAKGIVYKMNIREKGLKGNLPRLATDMQGNVWGYTSKELVKINAADITFSTYSFQYGVDGDNFFHFSFLPSGEMVFGGRNDITIADPSELKRNTEIPIPYINTFHVLNQPVDLLTGEKRIRLKYKQNFFSIGFSAKAFTMAKNIKFRYRLNDFDDWTEVNGSRMASYTNVPGGSYVFQLQAANNEGVWNEKILELPIFISTAFWLTWWFRIAVVVLVLAAIYFFYRHRVEQMRKKQSLKTEYERKLANVEMSALLAQMNPHFLFNSLNSIDSYIIRNESKKASEYLNNFARLMRLILQNSRSNYISLKDELEALGLYLQMESLRFKDKFSYSVSVDENVDTNSIVIPPMLIQPYIENAIWHGLMHKTNGEEGKVELMVRKESDNLLCIIRDNGIGRKKAGELKAQRHSNHKRSMGMQITHDRIEIINKLYNINASVNIFDMDDELGEAKGTRVELTIPV